MPTKNPSTGIRIFLDAKKILDDCAENRGINQVEFSSRILNWFAKQDEPLQAIILGQINVSDELSVIDIIRARIARDNGETARANLIADEAREADKKAKLPTLAKSK